jgi:hypothetical protein
MLLSVKRLLRRLVARLSHQWIHSRDEDYFLESKLRQRVLWLAEDSDLE